MTDIAMESPAPLPWTIEGESFEGLPSLEAKSTTEYVPLFVLNGDGGVTNANMHCKRDKATGELQRTSVYPGMPEPTPINKAYGIAASLFPEYPTRMGQEGNTLWVMGEHTLRAPLINLYIVAVIHPGEPRITFTYVLVYCGVIVATFSDYVHIEGGPKKAHDAYKSGTMREYSLEAFTTEGATNVWQHYNELVKRIAATESVNVDYDSMVEAVKPLLPKTERDLLDGNMVGSTMQRVVDTFISLGARRMSDALLAYCATTAPKTMAELLRRHSDCRALDAISPAPEPPAAEPVSDTPAA